MLLRVFPRRTSATPDDEDVVVNRGPSLYDCPEKVHGFFLNIYPKHSEKVLDKSGFVWENLNMIFSESNNQTCNQGLPGERFRESPQAGLPIKSTEPRMRSLPGFPGYFVTDNGCVLSIRARGWPQTVTLLKRRASRDGYLLVNLVARRKRRAYLVHRLVLEAFVGPCPDGMQCRHLNSNPSDNRLANLCWGTPSENAKDAIRNGTHVSVKWHGQAHPMAKLTRAQVLKIEHLYRTGSYKQIDLAEKFDVSATAIGAIVHRKTWRHLWK